jgi:hypothetical protein
LVGVIGFVGWRMYDSSQQANNQQNAQNGNGQTQEPTTRTSLGVDEYFEPANISFRHPAKWTYDTAGLTMKFANQPDLKYVRLSTPYVQDDGRETRYDLSFSIDSAWSGADSAFKSFDNLGEIQLGKQKMYILRAHYDPAYVGEKMNTITTSSCPDKLCALKFDETNLYFSANAVKGTQTPRPIDDVMVPEIVAILKTLKIGK